jgi:cobalt/nickel transport system permease protein
MLVAKLVVVAHLPIMVVEGLVTAFAVKFLKRVKPEMLEGVYAR